MRLIDADTIDDVVQDLNENHNSGITRNEYKRITSVMYEMPTIDAVSVVRCKDCKYGEIEENVPYWTCSQWYSATDYDGYCHYGERKDDEHSD